MSGSLIVQSAHRFATALAWRQCGCVNALVSLQGWRLREVFATNIAAVGLVACVAHAVAQQALGVGEGLCAHLAREELFSSVAVDMGAEEDAPGEGFATVGANMW